MTQWGLDNLFNPGKRHMEDEKRRLQSTREEVGDASGGRRIDLEGGTVSISVRRPAAAVPAEDVDDAIDTADDAADGTALDPALEAEEVPTVALANDEVEIVPPLVDEPAGHADSLGDAAAQPEADTLQEDLVDSVASVEAVAVEAPAVEPEPEPAPAARVEPEPTPQPAPAAPRRRAQSASAWSRGG